MGARRIEVAVALPTEGDGLVAYPNMTPANGRASRLHRLLQRGRLLGEPARDRHERFDDRWVELASRLALYLPLPSAVSYRCAFDSVFLHRCARHYSQTLDPGAHVLRVSAVTRAGTLSRVAVVGVRVRLPVPELKLDAPIAVGSGAGVLAIGAGAIWVPTTRDGMLARVDPASGAVTARVRVGPEKQGRGSDGRGRPFWLTEMMDGGHTSQCRWASRTTSGRKASAGYR